MREKDIEYHGSGYKSHTLAEDETACENLCLDESVECTHWTFQIWSNVCSLFHEISNLSPRKQNGAISGYCRTGKSGSHISCPGSLVSLENILGCFHALKVPESNILIYLIKWAK